MEVTALISFRAIASLSALLLLLGSCASAQLALEEENPTEVPESQEVRTVEIPSTPENSRHGYLLDDDRIPSISSCAEWNKFWDGAGPAASFAIAEKYPELEGLEVSTQIYLKNESLDPDQNGILCYDDSGLTEALPQDVNDPAKRLETDECKLRGHELGVGFPRPRGFLPSDGVVSAVMLFVEFQNVKVSEDIQEEARSYYEEFSNFMTVQSGGRQSWKFTVPNQVFSIDKNSSVYGADFSDPNFGNPDFTQYFRDAVRAADPFVDFSQFDVVYVIPPKQIGSSISYGPAFPRLYSGDITSDEGSIRAGATAGNDSRLGKNSEPWEWLAHETGHLYGLQHPLNEQGITDEFGRASASNVSLELWDLMTWMRSPSPDFWGWSRFWIGWLSDAQVYCTSKDLLADGLTIHLTFSDREQLPDEVSFVVIPLSSTRAIALESRNLYLDKRLLVEEVNIDRGEREGQIQIVPANDNKVEGWLDGSLSLGESLVHEGFEFKVTAESNVGVVVHISPAT